MGKTATLAAAPITVALTAIGSKAVSTAIDFTKLYESTMVVFEKMLGGKDAANALYASLLDVAKASTYSQETFLAAGKSLVGVGVSAEDTVRYLQAITDATAGFGGTSETIMRLSEAFKKIVTNGKISMMEMNMLSDAGVNALAILGNQYEVTTEEMRKMIADGALPAGEALAKLSEGIENGTNGANGMTSAMGGMAQAMKGGTLSGAFDGINSSIRAFSLSLVGINPTLKETDAAYEESQQRIQQLTAAVTTISEIIPLLAKVFSGVTSAIGNVLDALVGTNMYLDESTKKWTNVNGALGNFKRYLEATPADKLAVIGNGLVLIAATGPVLMVAGAALKGLSAVMAATAAVTKTAANAQLTYTMLVNSSTAATKVATVATSALRAAQITLNAAMLTNPAGVALLAIVALVGGVLALKVAYDSLNAGNESVTAATKAQGEEVDELRGKYESLKESTGESSEETLKAKAALDAAEESYRKIYQTMDSFIAESDAVIQKHQEMMAKMDDTVSAADEEAGSLLA
ncbi:MAG: tape measure protein, partial [Raoultibacter sp.]